ncbi:hypothetical protein ELS83_21405 [Marinifilum sp. JC070]|uniref:Lipoprotein n=2 Tax=Marinifilum caeruleilacunae TaxID=2499076 RepID=A0ABX1X1T3_9BACT|nr:hypothetical protein [Marinifilum caeruleilacunae]
MKKIIFYITALVFMSCSSGGSSNTQAQTNESKIDSQKQVADFVSKYNTYDVFKFEDSEIVQLVALKANGDNVVTFSLKNISKKSTDVSVLEGTAKLKEGDVEIDEDEEGIGYPVNEFIYNDKCWIAIRLALQSQDMVRVNSSDCESLSTKNTPFASKGVLKKME